MDREETRCCVMSMSPPHPSRPRNIALALFWLFLKKWNCRRNITIEAPKTKTCLDEHQLNTTIVHLISITANTSHPATKQKPLVSTSAWNNKIPRKENNQCSTQLIICRKQLGVATTLRGRCVRGHYIPVSHSRDNPTFKWIEVNSVTIEL